MLIGILFTVIISLAIGTFSVLTWRGQYKINRKFASPTIRNFALFWLLMSMVWYTIAAIDFYGYLGRRDISLILTYAMQVIVGFSLVIASSFLYRTLFPKQRLKFIIIIYSILYTIFLLSLFFYEVEIRPDSFFASQTISGAPTLFIFSASVIPLMFAGLSVFAIYYWQARKPDKAIRRFYILSGISLLLLGVAGTVDEVGIVQDWSVTAVRLVSLISSILAYFAIGALQEPDELVI
jgi:hypothetical protein